MTGEPLAVERWSGWAVMTALVRTVSADINFFFFILVFFLNAHYLSRILPLKGLGLCM